MKHIGKKVTLLTAIVLTTTGVSTLVYGQEQQASTAIVFKSSTIPEVAIDTTFASPINDWTGLKMDVFVRTNDKQPIVKGDQIKIAMPKTDLIDYSNARFGGELKSGDSAKPYYNATFSKAENAYIITFTQDLNRYEAMNLQISLPSSRQNVKNVGSQVDLGEVKATYNQEMIKVPDHQLRVEPTYFALNNTIQLGHGFPTGAIAGLPTDWDNYDNGEAYTPYKRQYTFSGFINGAGTNNAKNQSFIFKSDPSKTHNAIHADSFKVAVDNSKLGQDVEFTAMNGYKGIKVTQLSDSEVQVTIPDMSLVRGKRFIFVTVPDSFNYGAKAYSTIQVYNNGSLVSSMNAYMHQQ